jgi:hypothetical protein
MAGGSRGSSARSRRAQASKCSAAIGGSP